jgi:hypothetical protein
MTEGSIVGSIPLTNGSDPDPGGPKTRGSGLGSPTLQKTCGSCRSGCPTIHLCFSHLDGGLAQVDELCMPEGERAQAAEAGARHEGLVDDHRSS